MLFKPAKTDEIEKAVQEAIEEMEYEKIADDKEALRQCVLQVIKTQKMRKKKTFKLYSKQDIELPFGKLLQRDFFAGVGRRILYQSLAPQQIDQKRTWFELY